MGFMFCDLHVSLKQPFVGGYKFVEFVLFITQMGTKMDQIVCNDIACNCIHFILMAFFEDFNCVFTQIRCLSRVLLIWY